MIFKPMATWPWQNSLCTAIVARCKKWLDILPVNEGVGRWKRRLRNEADLSLKRSDGIDAIGERVGRWLVLVSLAGWQQKEYSNVTDMHTRSSCQKVPRKEVVKQHAVEQRKLFESRKGEGEE